MTHREALLAAIAREKSYRDGDWKQKVKALCRELWELEHQFDEHEDHGNEQRGRHIHRADCPAYDKMGDNSRP